MEFPPFNLFFSFLFLCLLLRPLSWEDLFTETDCMVCLFCFLSFFFFFCSFFSCLFRGSDDDILLLL
jgi:hypothetical protein